MKVNELIAILKEKDQHEEIVLVNKEWDGYYTIDNARFLVGQKIVIECGDYHHFEVGEEVD